MNYNERKQYAEKLIREDKYPDALVEYSVLFKENPEDPENMERFLFLFKRIQDGNYDFEPETSEQFIMRGIAKFYNQELNGSVEDYGKALSLDSNNHYALKSRAFSFKFLGKMEEAISDLKRAVEIKQTGEYYDDLSEVYQLIGDYKSAFTYHEKAIQISPDNPRLWYNYGVDLMNTNDLKGALEKYDKAIELWPKYEDAIVNKQYVLKLLKN